MQRGRGGQDEFFGMGDPFAEFGGFGRSRSLMSSFLGGRDPFDDPFFTRPFGSMMGQSMFGPSMIGPGMFPDQGSFFGETSNPQFLEQGPSANMLKGPLIQELSDDDDNEEERNGKEKIKDTKNHSRTHKGPFVQEPDEAVEVIQNKSRHVHSWNNFNHPNMMQSQGNTFSFQSSSVTYGGPNGAYYTSSMTRRMGGNGVVMEESKEADSTTGRAAHRISRGLRDKGHSVTRKLNSDGRVDTVQTLHNLNEDEIPIFEETWKGNARRHLPGWNQGHDLLRNQNFRSGSNRRQEAPRGWALPSTEKPHGSSKTNGSSK
ncbi:myeloid leukemia factor 1-like [Zingiber officinale]|uniref:Myeloid leukemia factor 1 n=1 Tax=Zingiber officinale TaxID=94328 RepID=A0A8J5F058_ZINOF|nr:myeloid leukemia factor 1-like [Zingiber officinale]XP_042435318.1 myeloid leukemia factor 1-like [Zingiber officinale]XP_042435319.1 myeloid leukemia factor 1-like [Zingiber officinale]KAG6478837.1 hypothetical protein ZIOFF_062281 [Zingiber officinale]